MNILNHALFSIFILLTAFYAAFGFHIYKIDTRSKMNMFFLMMYLSLGSWSLGYAFMFIASNIYIANFWRIIGTIGWCSFFYSWLLFTFNLNKQIITKKMYYGLMIPGIISFLLYLSYKPTSSLIYLSYGYIEKYPIDFVQVFYTFYYVSFSIGGIISLYSWGRSTITKREKLQAKIIGGVALIAILIGTIIDVILPIIFKTIIFHFTIIVITIAILVIWYIISKYETMILTPNYVLEYMYRDVKDPIAYLDLELNIKNCNDAFSDFIGYEKEQNLQISDIIEDSKDDIYALIKQGKEFGFEGRLKRKDGTLISIRLSGNMVFDKYKDYLGIVIILHDLTEIKNNELMKEAQINHMIYYDNLTGLPNRRFFNEYINKRINEEATYFAVLFMDIDNFKIINDTYGHEKGDELLQFFTWTVNKALGNNIMARIGGDEFLLLMNGLNMPKDINGVEDFTKEIMKVLKKPFYIEDKENFISVSMGVAFYPEDGESSEALVRNADMAMYEAKNSGRNNVKFITSEIKNGVMEKNAYRNSLYRALEKNELEVYYQPKVNILKNNITGFEALLRWRRKNGKFISPNIFIPIAEDTGLIVEIGYWLIKNACMNLKKWQEIGTKDYNMAINLSLNQLKQNRFTEIVRGILEEFDIEPCFVEFEITERMTIKGIGETEKALDKLKKIGVKISIDDFGTDFSSFMNIKKLPIDKIKIAMEFTQELNHNKKDNIIVKSIIDLAHNLGLTVIAEGVETLEQLDFLKFNHCDEVQGYYFYRPMEEGKVEEIILEEKLKY